MDKPVSHNTASQVMGALCSLKPWPLHYNVSLGRGGEQGGLKFLPLVTFNPSFRPIFVGYRLFALFFGCKIFHNVAQFFPISPTSRHLGNPTSHPSSPASRTIPAAISPRLPSTCPPPLPSINPSKYY